MDELQTKEAVGLSVPSVRPMVPRDLGRWNSYVLGHPDATFFHLGEWRTVLDRAFGHETHFLIAERAGEIVGVLPLGRIRSRLFGDSLISTPFCVYGGVLASDEDAARALDTAAVDLAERLGVGHLELRARRRSHPDWSCKDLYVTFRRSIAPDPEANLQRIPRKQRAMVRKGIAAGLEGTIDRDVERFYPVYAESVRALGTPVFSKRYFRALADAFGERCEILTVRSSGRPIASVMSFYFRDEVLPYYGGGTAASRAVAGNDFLYWDLMRRAAERGVRIFDFGRSKKDAGSYHFKRHWGFEPEPLFYEIRLIRSTSVPDVNPLNPKYRLFIAAWKRLPLPVSNVVGPWIARSLG
jgi:FemAB-related protein (PEP-CTERM system-associated)